MATKKCKRTTTAWLHHLYSLCVSFSLRVLLLCTIEEVGVLLHVCVHAYRAIGAILPFNVEHLKCSILTLNPTSVGQEHLSEMQ